MKKIITSFMEHEALKKQPPVLIDVGASGEIHKEWALIAPYAVCIAFDGDADRCLCVDENGNEKETISFGPVCVHPKYQRMGYGKILIEHSFEKAKEKIPFHSIFQKCIYFLQITYARKQTKRM